MLLLHILLAAAFLNLWYLTRRLNKLHDAYTTQVEINRFTQETIKKIIEKDAKS